MLKESFCKLTSTSGLFAYRRAIISERERRRRRIRLAGIFVSVPVRTMWAHSRLLTQKLPPRNSRQQLNFSYWRHHQVFILLFSRPSLFCARVLLPHLEYIFGITHHTSSVIGVLLHFCSVQSRPLSPATFSPYFAFDSLCSQNEHKGIWYERFVS